MNPLNIILISVISRNLIPIFPSADARRVHLPAKFNSKAVRRYLEVADSQWPRSNNTIHVTKICDEPCALRRHEYFTDNSTQGDVRWSISVKKSNFGIDYRWRSSIKPPRIDDLPRLYDTIIKIERYIFKLKLDANCFKDISSL